MTDHSGATGIWATASGYTMNAKPGPDSSQRTQHMSTRYYTETT